MFACVTERGTGGCTEWNVMFRPGTGCDEICAHCVGVYVYVFVWRGQKAQSCRKQICQRPLRAKHANRFFLPVYTLNTRVILLKVAAVKFSRIIKWNRFCYLIQAEIWLWKHSHLITNIWDIQYWATMPAFFIQVFMSLKGTVAKTVF